ncbi:MAG: hypothetical protein AMXMBFR61_07140 [Fimbriimonadales bacterium]
MGYRDAWALQRDLHARRVAGSIPDVLLLLEHDPVITLGRGFHPENLLYPREEYARRGIEVVETDRGGDVTYHGPGQLVGYPIFDLRERGRDVHRFLRDVEEAIILVLREHGIEGERRPPHTGVWVGSEKVCAIGIKVSKWVSLHGFALNVSNDLSPFESIIPCGISGLGVTSLGLLMGGGVSLGDASVKAEAAFGQVFGLRFASVDVASLSRLDLE